MPPQFGDDSVPHMVAGLEFHPLNHEVVVYDADKNRLHHLNPTAALILELCDGVRSCEQLAAEVQQAYGLEDRPLQHVDRCLAEFRVAGLIR